ncbi:hypothetical protein GCM10022406_30480 [Hymenobacter algoricola]|uniref:Uncharacterized protein n=1 Tax=Hymenobacter algoricola TaxID=486267 RepID=A0ABP7NGE5_9BACT
MQRFFGNAPLGALGFTLIQGEKHETQDIEKKQATQEYFHGAGAGLSDSLVQGLSLSGRCPGLTRFGGFNKAFL